jgi:type IV pilus assembly protein PilM
MFERIRGIFSHSKKFLGIDVGTFSIRVVELERKGDIFNLSNYGEVEISDLNEKPFLLYKKDNLLLSNDKIAKTLQAICSEAGIQTKSVNFSIPDYCSFFTNFELPPMAKEEISEAIKYEVRPYIPLPLSEITLDWSIVSGEVGKTPLKVLVVAVPNDIINQYKEIAFISGFELIVLEPEVFSLARALSRSQRDKKIISLIDIGARSTTCSVLEEGVLKVSHSFNIAGSEFTEAIARSMDFDYQKAEGIKKFYGIANGNIKIEQKIPEDIKNFSAEKKEEMQKVITPLVDLILEESKKIFRDFYQKEGKEVERVVLAGGVSLMPGLKEYFSKELNKEAVLGNPFWGISCPEALFKVLDGAGPSYSVATGVALKGLE